LRPFIHFFAGTQQYVPELRQFVDIGLAHEITEGELTWIFLGGLQAVSIAIVLVFF